MARSHEQAVADSFNRLLRRYAQTEGVAFREFALDGQDRDAGADYLITDTSRFSLVEFKYSQRQIFDESKKPRRVNLCRLLEDLEIMRSLHDQCHFISYMNDVIKKMNINIYRKEVCNHRVMGRLCAVSDESPDEVSRLPINRFCQNFWDPTAGVGLDVDEFEAYLHWLMTEASSSSTSTLELLAVDDTDETGGLIEFSSVREAYNWFSENR
jgi:hypothetical protein